jgi:hypothetical protein
MGESTPGPALAADKAGPAPISRRCADPLVCASRTRVANSIVARVDSAGRIVGAIMPSAVVIATTAARIRLRGVADGRPITVGAAQVAGAPCHTSCTPDHDARVDF